MNFLERARLVDKETPRAVSTEVHFVERLALPRLVVVLAASANGRVGVNVLKSKRVLTVRKLAFLAVATDACLDPVFAKLRPKLRLVEAPLRNHLVRSFALAGFSSLLHKFPLLNFDWLASEQVVAVFENSSVVRRVVTVILLESLLLIVQLRDALFKIFRTV